MSPLRQAAKVGLGGTSTMTMAAILHSTPPLTCVMASSCAGGSPVRAAADPQLQPAGQAVPEDQGSRVQVSAGARVWAVLAGGAAAAQPLPAARHPSLARCMAVTPMVGGQVTTHVWVVIPGNCSRHSLQDQVGSRRAPEDSRRRLCRAPAAAQGAGSSGRLHAGRQGAAGHQQRAATS